MLALSELGGTSGILELIKDSDLRVSDASVPVDSLETRFALIECTVSQR
jgi:uncharacterized Ntn-hydrolase superfamily protein